MIDANELKITLNEADLTKVDFDNIEKELPIVSGDTVEEEGFDVEFDDDEYTKGIKLGSYIAGILAPILAIGVPVELAVDMVSNERGFAFNKEALSLTQKASILEEELGIE